MGRAMPQYSPAFKSRMLRRLVFAVAANVAVVHAIFRVVRGHEDHLWEPTRRTPPIPGT